jgi:hypothetical protein
MEVARFLFLFLSRYVRRTGGLEGGGADIDEETEGPWLTVSGDW